MGVPPKKGVAYTFDVCLVDQANRPGFRNNPTIVAGDVTVSTDGGAFANANNLPTTNGYQVRVQLSASEMNGDRIQVLFHDAAGAEWDDLAVALTTDTITIGEIASTIASAVWSYARRVLTTSFASIPGVKKGADLSIYRGDTLDLDVVRLGDISGRTNLWFTVKSDKDDADTRALIQIDETTGLLYINGTVGTAGNGSITVTDATEGNITIRLEAVEAAKLDPRAGAYGDIQYTDGTDVTTLARYDCCITGDVTKATS